MTIILIIASYYESNLTKSGYHHSEEEINTFSKSEMKKSDGTNFSGVEGAYRNPEKNRTYRTEKQSVIDKNYELDQMNRDNNNIEIDTVVPKNNLENKDSVKHTNTKTLSNLI